MTCSMVGCVLSHVLRINFGMVVYRKNVFLGSSWLLEQTSCMADSPHSIYGLITLRAWNLDIAVRLPGKLGDFRKSPYIVAVCQ